MRLPILTLALVVQDDAAEAAVDRHAGVAVVFGFLNLFIKLLTRDRVVPTGIPRI